MQPVTLYLTITVSANIPSPIIPNKPPEIPTKGNTLAEQTTRRSMVPVFGVPIRPAALGPLLPPPGYLPVGTGTLLPHGQAEMSPTEIAQMALRRADKAKPIDRTKTWERAIGRIKRVMDTVSPIAEVRAISILPLLD